LGIPFQKTLGGKGRTRVLEDRKKGKNKFFCLLRRGMSNKSESSFWLPPLQASGVGGGASLRASSGPTRVPDASTPVARKRSIEEVEGGGRISAQSLFDCLNEKSPRKTKERKKAPRQPHNYDPPMEYVR
jgi:hypothetical protein